MAKPPDSDRSRLSSAGLEVTERADPDGTATFLVRGDTHPHRQLLRELGGQWDKLRFGWTFTGDDPSGAIARALKGTSNRKTANRTGAGRKTSGLAEKDGMEKYGDGEFSRENRPHYWGHRQRLRERFMAAGGNALPDYELLELLLFQSIPRVDVKPLAKQLIAKFGTLAGVLSAAPEALAEIPEVSAQTIVHLKAVREAGLRLARAEAMEGPVIGSWDKLLDYCRANMAHESVEQFRLLFLDRKNRLIADEVQQKGSVDHTPVYPREVVRRALELRASAIIMVHNHPSGDPTPSRGDIDMTQEVRAACETLGIALHDHVVIARTGHASFRTLGLL